MPSIRPFYRVKWRSPLLDEVFEKDISSLDELLALFRSLPADAVVIRASIIIEE